MEKFSVDKTKYNFDEFINIQPLKKAVELRAENPKLSKKDICKEVGISKKTLNELSSEFGVKTFKKKIVKKTTDVLECDKCGLYCKGKSGLTAHYRKHYNEHNKSIVSQSQGGSTLPEGLPKVYKKGKKDIVGGSMFDKLKTDYPEEVSKIMK